jgi:hypothetical protein
MKAFISVMVISCIGSASFSQMDTGHMNDSIYVEGFKLYRSEIASWYGTDLLSADFSYLKSDIGGYFSYSENYITNCVFFSKGDNPRILLSITFDTSYRSDRAIVDTSQRNFSVKEKDLYTIRKLAKEAILNDTLFKQYTHANLNLIPLISENTKRVYILTGPDINGKVIFGNDYLLTFDSSNYLKSKRKLHSNIIVLDYEENDTTSESTFHTHLPETGDFFTSTDVCTLLLYGKFTKWKWHHVIAKDYISIWTIDKHQLLSLTREAWDRIYKHK